MKRGKIRTVRDYDNGGFKIQGNNGTCWVDVWENEETKTILRFDLEYDACAYIDSVYEAINDKKQEIRKSIRLPKLKGKSLPENKINEAKNKKLKRRKNNKQSRGSRKRNR